MEPFRVDDFVNGSKTLPPRLEATLKAEQEPHEPMRTFAVVLDVLMTEVGFQRRRKRQSEPKAIVYEYDSDFGANVTLAVVSVGPATLIHGSVNGQTISINDLRPANFVLPLKDLKRLSRRFKDDLARPLLASARRVAGVEEPEHDSLLGLPEEILVHILSKADDAQTLCRMSRTSRQMARIASHWTLWRHLFGLKYADVFKKLSAEKEVDWKAEFRKEWIKRKSFNSLHAVHFIPPEVLIPPQPPFPLRPRFDPPDPFGGGGGFQPPWF